MPGSRLIPGSALRYRPRVVQTLATHTPSQKPRNPKRRLMSYKKWHCLICDLVYDEAQGWPSEGIAPGTRWEDVPDSWACPDCGASKADFLMVEVA